MAKKLTKIERFQDFVYLEAHVQEKITDSHFWIF